MVELCRLKLNLDLFLNEGQLISLSQVCYLPPFTLFQTLYKMSKNNSVLLKPESFVNKIANLPKKKLEEDE